MAASRQSIISGAVGLMLLGGGGVTLAGCGNSNTGGPSAPVGATVSTPGKQGHGADAPKQLRTGSATRTTTTTSSTSTAGTLPQSVTTRSHHKRRHHHARASG